MAKGDKYIELSNYLKNCHGKNVSLSFDEIQNIIGFNLPKSAFNPNYSWWGNDKYHSQAVGWMGAGYIVKVDFSNKTAQFIYQTKNLNT